MLGQQIEMKLSLKTFINSLFLLFLPIFPAYGQIRLPALISDGIVLQRDVAVKIWGWARPGEKVSLSFNELSLETITGNDTKWEITLPPQKAGGPYEMKLDAGNHINLKNILLGDVWLCSGQSNMEYPMSRLTDKYATEIEQSENPGIRQFKIPQKYNFNDPQENYASGSWVEANPKTIPDFSAVAYFFALELYEKYHIPIGIINASLGGSPAEAWMSADALVDFPQYLEKAEKFKNQSFISDLQDNERKASDEWYTELNKLDKGLHANPNWKNPAIDASGWPSMPVPSYWADHGLDMVNGVVWFLKDIDIPEPFTHTNSWIQLGRMVDADSVFINGSFVGTTSYQYPQRKYAIPSGILKAGKNRIVIRLISNSGKAGFVSDKPYQIVTNKDTFDLKGNWQYQTGCTMPPTPGRTSVQWQPTGLYNAMIAPSNHYKIKGVVWYQGESNAERFQEYQKLFSSLISDWRMKRDQGDLSFIIAQLPNYMESKKQPAESSWASFRNVQLKIAQSVENTILSVNIDLGEWNDVHPQNKKDVGKRLALAAEELVYNQHGTKVLGPVYESMKIKGNKICIKFANCGNGLVSIDGKSLKQFALAGPDHKYVWATASIKRNKVVVRNDTVKDPAYVRYAWADNPDGANLFSKDGLPASPFTTER